jgi:hypothetical protein
MNLYYHSSGRGSRFANNTVEYVFGAEVSPPPFNSRPKT